MCHILSQPLPFLSFVEVIKAYSICRNPIRWFYAFDLRISNCLAKPSKFAQETVSQTNPKIAQLFTLIAVDEIND